MSCHSAVDGFEWVGVDVLHVNAGEEERALCRLDEGGVAAEIGAVTLHLWMIGQGSGKGRPFAVTGSDLLIGAEDDFELRMTRSQEG